MGTWGTSLYSDDLASDLKGDLRDLIGDGLTIEVAVDRVLADYKSSLDDADEAPVVWLAIADAAWRLGRPHAQATAEALRIIEDGVNLRRWPSAKDRAKRNAVLVELGVRLRSPAPAPKRVPRVFKGNNLWTVGEIVSFRLLSGSYTALRVIGHSVDRGGKHAVCEPLDWIGLDAEMPDDLRETRVRASRAPWQVSQVMIVEPRRKADSQRFNRTGLMSPPQQEPRGYMVVGFPHIDRWLSEIFGIG